MEGGTLLDFLGTYLFQKTHPKKTPSLTRTSMEIFKNQIQENTIENRGLYDII